MKCKLGISTSAQPIMNVDSISPPPTSLGPPFPPILGQQLTHSLLQGPVPFLPPSPSQSGPSKTHLYPS